MNKPFSTDRASNEKTPEKIPGAASHSDSQGIRFAFRVRLSDLDEGTQRRRRSAPVQETARVKTEKELREDAAWQQVKQTGKPILFEDCLLLPESMSISEAITYLPDDIREQTGEAWDEKLVQLYGIFLDGAETQLREKMAESGKLDWYDSLPWSVKAALKASIVRQQLGYPEVPLQDLIREYERPEDKSTGGKGIPEINTTRKAKRTGKQSKEKYTVTAIRRSDMSEDRAEKTPQSAPVAEPDHVASDRSVVHENAQPAALSRPISAREILGDQRTSEQEAVAQWNKEHHRFLLKRLDQIISYLDAEEQLAVQELLKRRIGKEEIDQIDEIIKGVEWARRLQG